MKEGIKATIRVVTSIVISAVLLGLVVAYCIRTWMPTELLDWALWGVMAGMGIFAIYRITNLAKMLNNKDKE